MNKTMYNIIQYKNNILTAKLNLHPIGPLITFGFQRKITGTKIILHE